MKREIVHVNTDDFFASVMRMRDPALRGRPVVVSGPLPRGVVQSASYEARGDGVERGMPVSAALKLCPRGEFLSPDWKLFRRVSAALFAALRNYSPVLEPVSLDECYVDYTGCGRLMGGVLDAAAAIKRGIREGTGLEVSLGVASSRLVSHVASREAKRAHLVDVSHGCERGFLAPLRIERFPLAAGRDIPLLRELGIARVGDILGFPEEVFSVCFGSWGSRLYRGAMGEDLSPVRPAAPEQKRFSAERELDPDRVSASFLDAALYSLAEAVGQKLRGNEALAGSLRMELAYTDGASVEGSQETGGTSDDGVIFSAASKLLSRLFRRRVRVRRIRLEAGRLSSEPRQIPLFPCPEGAAADRRRRLQSALDHLRSKFPPGVTPVTGRALRALEKPATGGEGGRKKDGSARAETPGRKNRSAVGGCQVQA